MKTLRTLTSLLLALLMLMLASCADVEKTGAWESAEYDRDTTLGKGEKTITVLVTAEEQTLTFTIHTDKTTLGEALGEHNLIDGEEGAYGMYVKYVNGIEADYNVDQTYWGVFLNGVLAPTGVDGITITDGGEYELRKTK